MLRDIFRFKTNLLLVIISYFVMTACSPFGNVSVVEIKAPALSWDNSSYDFGNLNLGSMNIATFTLTNHGLMPATGCSPIVLSDTVNFSVDMDNCTNTSMESAAECSVDIASHPTTLGVKSLTISRVCENHVQVSSNTNQIVATGVPPPAPVLAWSPLTFDFNTIYVGAASSVQAFTLSNSGTVDATGCGQPTLSNTTDFAITANTCGTAPVTAGGSCIFSILAQPQSAGVQTATISRTCTVGGTASTTSQQITTTGFTIPNLFWNPLTRNFGSVGVGNNSIDRVFDFYNTGTADATSCGAPTLTDNTNFTIVSDTCSNNDAIISTTCSVTMHANPQSVGLKTTTISRTCGYGGTVTTTSDQITTTGYALVPSLSWSLLSYDFGNVNVGANSSNVSITMNNSGSAAATGCSAPTISDTTNFSIMSDSCSTSNLSAGGSCAIQVRANPISAGLKQATVSRTCSVGGTISTTTNQITTTGVALMPSLAWSPMTYDFGAVGVNVSTSDQTFTLMNSGLGVASGCSAPTISDTSNFTIASDGCNTSNVTASGGTCSIQVHGNPASLGSKTATISRTCTVGGTVSTTSNQITVLGSVNIVNKLALGASHTCALGLFGGVKCWGINYNGQLGYNSAANSFGETVLGMQSLAEVYLGAGKTAKDISASEQYNCAILNDDTLKCWGQNSYGQLGYGDTTTRGNVPGSMEALNPVNVGSGRTVKKISAGHQHMCAILDNNTLKCWGRNFTGALGYGAGGDLSAPSASAINLGSGRTAKAVSAGYIFTCAILDDDTVKCWGLNDYGQLGLNTSTDVSTPASTVYLGAGRTAKSIAAGYAHVCAILDNNTVKCWGANSTGQLGLNNTTTQGNVANSMQNLPAVYLGVGRTAKSIAARVHSSCAVLDDDTVKCWGYNNYGTLGYDDIVWRGNVANSMENLIPVYLGVSRTAKSVVLGGYHSCSILDDNTIKCWGQNSGGQLGYGDTGNRALVGPGYSTVDLPNVYVGASLTVKDLAVGNGQTCAILSDDSLKCWGGNWNGKLGYNDTATRGNVASSMENLGEVYLGSGRTALAIGAGSQHTCAILDDNTVKCWGYNAVGQLGYNTTANKGNTANSMQSLAAVDLGAGRTAKKLAVGGYQTCVILDDDTLKCWGSNGTGQLGYNDTTNRGDTASSMQNLNPVYLGAGRTAKYISTGQNHTCAILDDNTSKCWGHGLQGNLGNGTSTSYGNTANSMQSLPTINFGSGRTAKTILAGNGYTCATLDNNTSKCWGYGYDGALGYNSSIQLYAPAESPIEFNSSLTVKKIANGPDSSYGSSSTCAILSDDSLKCWGNGGFGNLGYNDNTNRGLLGFSIQYQKTQLYSP